MCGMLTLLACHLSAKTWKAEVSPWSNPLSGKSYCKMKGSLLIVLVSDFRQWLRHRVNSVSTYLLNELASSSWTWTLFHTTYVLIVGTGSKSQDELALVAFPAPRPPSLSTFRGHGLPSYTAVSLTQLSSMGSLSSLMSSKSNLFRL